jgi:hypothetical protein
MQKDFGGGVKLEEQMLEMCPTKPPMWAEPKRDTFEVAKREDTNE